MGRVIFLEILDRRGEVASRVRAARFPFAIGRSYTNDLILEDPHVDAAHLVIDREADDRLVLRDLGSLNGTTVAGEKGRIDTAPITSGLRFRVGRTSVRVRTEDHTVAPAAALSHAPPVVRWLMGSWSAALLLGLLLWLKDVAMAYRRTWTEFEPFALWLEPAFELWGPLVWAGSWALVTRLLIHRSRFFAHWALICGAVLLDWVVTEALRTAHFLFAPIEPFQLANVVWDNALIGLVVFGNLSVAAVARPTRRAIAAAGIACAFLLHEVVDFVDDREDWVSVLPYWSRLEPLPIVWLRPRSVDDFFQEVHTLAPQLDELAREEE